MTTRLDAPATATTPDTGPDTGHDPGHDIGPAHTIVDTPIGQLRLVARAGQLTDLHLEPDRDPAAADAVGARDDDHPVLVEAVRQLTDYLAGRRTDFDLPLRLAGTAFQRRVWAALQEIPYGETISYGQLAARLGSPGASRAVGLANGRNPVPVLVPCHRVVAADGTLGGYSGGLERKRHLLELERASAS